jgi:hypothetical protein
MFPFKRQEDPEVELQRQNLRLNDKEIMTKAALSDDPYFLQNAEQRENLTRWQQDLLDELDQLKFGLLNYEEINGEWRPREGMPPDMNPLGVARVINLVRNYLSRNVMNSNLDDNIIRNIMVSFSNALALELAENYSVYDLDMSVYHSVNVKVRHMVYFTLYRAYKDGERRHQETQRKMIEAYSDRPEQPKKGFTGNLFGG